MRGHLRIGRGSKQKSFLSDGIVADNYKVAVCGRDLAIQRRLERVAIEVSLQDRLATQACHADALITAYRTSVQSRRHKSRTTQLWLGCWK